MTKITPKNGEVVIEIINREGEKAGEELVLSAESFFLLSSIEEREDGTFSISQCPGEEKQKRISEAKEKIDLAWNFFKDD